MTSYAYLARSRKGKTIRGVRAAVNEAALARDLAAEALFLIKSGPVHEARKRFGGPKVKRKELISFILHLGSYQEAGVPVITALEDYRLPDQPAVDAAIQDMRRRIEAGASLSEAMDSYPTLFSPLHVSMIRAGESSGQMDQVLRELVRLVEWEEDFKSQVKQAATYPLVLLTILTLVVMAVVTVAMPGITKLLLDMRVPLPLSTRILLNVGGGLAQWGWLVALLGFGAGVSFKAALSRPAFRLWWDTLVLHLPLAGQLITKLGMSRFATFFAAQYRAGIPIVTLLKECQNITGNARLGLCVRQIREGVESGERLAAVAAGIEYFPLLVVRMLAIGEEAGNLEQTLGKVSQYFDVEVKAGIKRFFQALEPLLMAGMAGLVGFIAISILLPIYTMIGSINAAH